MLFGKTRNAFYKKETHEKRKIHQEQLVLDMVHMIRRELPGVGTPKLYHMLKKPLHEHGIKMGRDVLHKVLCNNGLIVKPKKRYVVTTNSKHWMKKYPNLVRDLSLSKPEQLWVSDITYIHVGDDFNFLSLITDAYSKKIMGYHLHHTLAAEGCLRALKMALKQKSNSETRHIHHSDRGSQYCCSEYVKTLQAANIGISMTEKGDPYENAIAERVNGILKHEFHLNREFKTRIQAKEMIERSVRAYNHLRPHMSCNYLTPAQAHQTKGDLNKKWKHKKYANPIQVKNHQVPAT